MAILALLLLPPLIGLAVIIIIAIWGANVLAYRFIGRKHQWLEEILATGDIPQRWQQEAAATLARQRQQASNTAAVNRRRQRVQRRHLRQFDQLIHYAGTTALVADEETRDVLLAQLLTVRAEWSARQLDDRAQLGKDERA